MHSQRMGNWLQEPMCITLPGLNRNVMLGLNVMKLLPNLLNDSGNVTTSFTSKSLNKFFTTLEAMVHFLFYKWRQFVLCFSYAKFYTCQVVQHCRDVLNVVTSVHKQSANIPLLTSKLINAGKRT